MIHQLKLSTEFFDDVNSGLKSFEYRKNDRDYKVGDILDLREFDRGKMEYTKRSCIRVVTRIVYGGNWGIPSEYCIMSIREKENG